MTAIEMFDQLHSDFDKTLIALLNVRNINEIQASRKMPGYVYNQDIGIHEYWIVVFKDF